MWKAAAEKSCDVHHGREEGPCFCHLTRKENQKGAVAELKLGRDRNSGGFRILWEVERKKSCFMGFAHEESLCLHYHVEFLSPNNHILSMFWSSPVLHGSLQFWMSVWDCALYCAMVKNSSLHRRLACPQSLSVVQLVCNWDASMRLQSERRKWKL